MSQTQDQQQQETPEQQNGKVVKRFTESMGKLVAILGKELPKSEHRKVPTDKMEALVAELFKEEDELAVKNLKEEIKALLKQYYTMQQEVGKKRKELEAVEMDQMKKFTEAGNKIFNKVEDMPAIQRAYREGLGKIVGEPAKGEEKVDDNNNPQDKTPE